jgi:hypothetical protein
MAMDVMYNNSKRYQYDRTRCNPITQTETPLSHEHTTEETPAKTNDIETQNKNPIALGKDPCHPLLSSLAADLHESQHMLKI